MVWSIFFHLLGAYFCGSGIVKLVFLMFRYFRLRELEDTPGMGIKVLDTLLDRKAHILNICFCAVFAFWCYSEYKDAISSAADFLIGAEAKAIYSHYAGFYSLTGIYFILACVISLLKIVLGGYGYLTPEGIIDIDKMYNTNKYRYTVDYEEVGEEEYNKFINVYKKNKKEKAPIRHQIIQDEERAIQWVNSFK